MFTAILIYAGLLPLATAALVAFVLRRLRVSSPATWACAVASGYVAAQVGLKSQAGYAVAVRALIQPVEAADWLPVLVLLAIGITFLWMTASPARWWLVFLISAAFTIAVPLRLLSLNVSLMQQWSPLEKVAFLSLAAAALGLIWVLLAAGSEQQQSLIRVLSVGIVAVGAALVLTLSGVLVYGQFCGAVAAALAGTALADFLGATGSASASQRFAFQGLTGAAGVLAVSLGSLILLGHFFADLRAQNAVLLFASLAAAGAPLPTVLLDRPLWQPLAVRIAFCLTSLAIAIASVVG